MKPEQIKYFKECYQTDNRALSLLNLFAGKIQSFMHFSHDKMMKAYQEGYVEVDPHYAQIIRESAEKYRREKSSIFVGHLLIGSLEKWQDDKKKTIKICAPLACSESTAEFLWSDSIIRLKPDSTTVNYELLESICKDSQTLVIRDKSR